MVCTICSGFYQTSDGCRHCHHYCRECDGSGPLHCKSCPPRFMLDGGLCMECLGSQYYDATSGSCKACDSTCRTCSGPGQFSCTACSRPLRLDRSVYIGLVILLLTPPGRLAQDFLHLLWPSHIL